MPGSLTSTLVLFGQFPDRCQRQVVDPPVEIAGAPQGILWVCPVSTDRLPLSHSASSRSSLFEL